MGSHEGFKWGSSGVERLQPLISKRPSTGRFRRECGVVGLKYHIAIQKTMMPMKAILIRRFYVCKGCDCRWKIKIIVWKTLFLRFFVAQTQEFDYFCKQNKRKSFKSITMKNLDWGSLSFGYMKTDYNVRCYYRDGKWGEIEVCSDEYLKLHMAATCLHYGQEAFEGLKAYRCPDGKVRVFRVDENAARLQSTCRGIMMPEVSTELFTEMVKKVVRLNQEWIPTYESGATLYIRPLLIGTSAQVGVHPAKEYCFLIFVTPVGPYFKGGFSSNPYVIVRDYDRSAPLGTGKYKVGGNYAASLFANNLAHEKGYACEFYLDAKEKKYIDECGAANFFGIKNNTYITPESTSILPSITNKSLMQVAEDLGMKVERRPIPEEELETFEEAGACGTAAVISPISYIDDLDTGKRYSFGDKPGPQSKRLFDTLRGIQYGEIEDKHGWTTVVIE